MSESRLSASGFLLVLQLGVWGIASSQNVAQSGDDLGTVEAASAKASQSPEFEIEVVVFVYNAFDPTEEQFNRNARSTRPTPDPAAEQRPIDAPLEYPIAAKGIAEPSDLPQSESVQDETAREPFQFSLLSPKDLKLTAACDRLERLEAYTVLIHGGWVQHGLPEERAHPFDLALLGAPNIAGTVELHVSRFLHVTAALDYHVSAKTSSPPQSATPYERQAHVDPPPKYELRQARRMRSGELHYFDHPAFGLLVTVRPHREDADDTADPG